MSTKAKSVAFAVFTFALGTGATAGAQNLLVPNGSIGVGLDVNGRVVAWQKLDMYGGNGRVQSGHSWLTNSDARYKKNVSTLENALTKVLSLRGVRYDTNDGADSPQGKGKHIGVIAQELEEQFPELVSTDAEGSKSVAYDKLGAILIQALKELVNRYDAKLAALDAEGQKLRAQVASFASLKSRLAAAESQLASAEQPKSSRLARK
jgi:hypothetical protein